MQLVITMLIAIAVYFFTADIKNAMLAIAGGLIAIAPNYYLFTRLTPKFSATPHKFIKAFYLNELIKLLLTIALYVMAFIMLDDQFAPLFNTYVSLMIVFWIGLAYVRQSSSKLHD